MPHNWFQCNSYQCHRRGKHDDMMTLWQLQGWHQQGFQTWWQWRWPRGHSELHNRELEGLWRSPRQLQASPWGWRSDNFSTEPKEVLLGLWLDPTFQGLSLRAGRRTTQASLAFPAHYCHVKHFSICVFLCLACEWADSLLLFFLNDLWWWRQRLWKWRRRNWCRGGPFQFKCQPTKLIVEGFDFENWIDLKKMRFPLHISRTDLDGMSEMVIYRACILPSLT